MPGARRTARDGQRSQTHATRRGGAAQFLTPNEAGREIGVTGVAVKQWIYQRRLPARKLPNGYWRIARADLELYLRERNEGGRRRVLLVRMKPPGCARAFADAGWQVFDAANPVDAALRAIAVRPSLVIMDVAEPGEGGWAAAARLRTTRGLHQTPLMILVAPGAEDDPAVIDRAVALGAQSCMTRGAAPAEVLAAALRLALR